MKKLIQKKIFKKFEFRISDSKLYCSTSKYGNSNEFDIPFENIDGEKVNLVTTNYLLFVAATCVLLTGIGTIGILILNNSKDVDIYMFGIITILFGLALFVYFWFTKESFWKIKLDNGNYIHFYKNLPNEETVEEFLSDLINKRDLYLRKNYSKIDKNLDYEKQLNNFRWLKAINAISQDEFDQKYSELQSVVNPSKTSIGFGK